MKFNLYFISLAIALCISLFFACTSELELPVHPDNYVEPSSSSVSQDWCVSDTQCRPAPVDGHCDDGWNLASYCSYSSSSSGNTGSSSSNNVGSNSSSSGDNSSSSSSIILATGDFDFRIFSNDNKSGRIYFLNTTNVYVTTNANGGNGKLLSTLTKTAAAIAAGCGDIAYKITGGGFTNENVPISKQPAEPSPTGLIFTESGEITAVAVITCNDEEIIWGEVTARVVPDPTLTACPAQILPSTYVAKTKKEYVKDLISVRDDLGRCSDVTYALGTSTTISTDSLNFAAYSGQQNNLNITARVTCNGVTAALAPVSCPISVFVADRYIEFVECKKTKEATTPTYTFSTGTTIFDYRCQKPDTEYYIKCSAASTTPVFTLEAEGYTKTTSSWGGANLPGYPTPVDPIENDDGYFYYPKRVLATVTTASSQGGCISWAQGDGD